MSKPAQWMQVLAALRDLGGIATLSQLNRALLAPDGAGRSWATKTPEATIRRIVRQQSEHFYVLKPGLYCLRERAAQFERDYTLPSDGDIPPAVENRNHSYYQGLLLEIGNARDYTTYVPPQDKNRVFGNQKLGEVSSITKLPRFGYSDFLRRASTVDVIWFNRREMPAEMFEVEMSGDMLNSLAKFNELRDFYARFVIVAPTPRQNHFADRMAMDTFHEIRRRVTFMGIDDLEKRHLHGR